MKVSALDTAVQNAAQQTSNIDTGSSQRLVLAPQCKVVLAMSAIESTRLALVSFPTGLMGRNLMVHMRSDFTVRIRRAAFAPLPPHLETAALLVRGATPQAVFHLQVTAAANQQSESDHCKLKLL